MGNALDIQFRKIESLTRCSGKDIDTIRTHIFVKHIGAQLGWNLSNKLSLETAAQGATSWVHVDVRQYDHQYMASRYYAVTQSAADGEPILEMTQKEGRFALLCCSGLPAANSSSAPRNNSVQTINGEDRINVSTLKTSPKGIEFIKEWEHCRLQPYNDSRGFCTIGWGHLIQHERCESIQEGVEFQKYKSGIDQSAAEQLLLLDIQKSEIHIKSRVQVPLFQHEYDALVSLILNIGSFKKCPKLLSKLNTRDYNGCCDEFSDITNQESPGLVKRRNCEMKVFRNNSYNTAH
jgi:GH24 family phage-related lysozyme (muramidase)